MNKCIWMDNYIENCHLGIWIVSFIIGNCVLQLSWHIAIKQIFLPQNHSVFISKWQFEHSYFPKWLSCHQLIIIVNDNCNWTTSWENLMPYADSKGTDQPAHPHSRISGFVVCCLDSIKHLLAIAEISRPQLVSVAEQAGLHLNWSKTPKTGFLMTKLNCKYCCKPWQKISSLWRTFHMSHVMRKPVFGVCDQVRLKPACSATETSKSL